ncbi:MAG: DnaA regulatory inactivator Hda [Gammaproteobacteria bacterium]|nr:MAG: DnaA regulatory inactivator Hda [Gammaproteobacteria bacterium]
MYPQLPLQISLSDTATFNNYLPGENLAAVETLKHSRADDSGPCVYLWGPPGCGKSHLLQSLCHDYAARGESALYLPLGRYQEYSADILEGLDAMDAVCLDDIHAICGLTEWETAIFHLYNRINDASGRLLVAANAAPAGLGMSLADLASRLSSAVVFHLRQLADEDRQQALRLRAGARGIHMPEEVAAYLLKRCPRDMQSLFDLLDRLDVASLSAQRKLTIPFVRELIND